MFWVWGSQRWRRHDPCPWGPLVEAAPSVNNQRTMETWLKKKKKKPRRSFWTRQGVLQDFRSFGFYDMMIQFSSVHFSRSVVSDSLQPHESQHARPPCPSPTPGVYSNSCPSSRWWHPAISSSVIPFSSCPQSLPASGSFPMSQLFTSGGQSTGVSASASVLPMNT